MSRKKQKSELRQALGACRGGFAMAAVFSFFINLLNLVSPLYMLQVYDRVLNSHSTNTLLMLTVLAVGMLLVLALLEFVRNQVLIGISAKMDDTLRSRLFTAVYERSLRVVRGEGRTQPLSDFNNVRNFLTGNGLFAFFDAPWTPIFLFVIFMFHPMLGFLALGGGVILILLALATEWATRAPLEAANMEAMANSQFADNSLRNIEVLHAMGMLTGVRGRWLAASDRVLDHQARASWRSAMISSASRFVRIALQTLLLGAGAYLTIKGEITAGYIIASSIIVGRALAPIEMTIGSWKSLVMARSAFHRLEELFAAVPAPAERMPLPRPTGAVTVENVVAVPPGGSAPTLRGVQFQIEPGEAIGIIGPSAAGKSTLARLLVGVWVPYAGKVRLDGADIANWDRDNLGPHVGYLPQDVELFDGTVSDNIARFGTVDAGKVIEAAQRAGIHDMILRLPNGYDTRIGESGGVLSGGQRQRMGLARALYGNPAFVVLDEPNSNLDEDGERALVQAIRHLKEETCTVVIIAHRPSVLATVDKVLVLRDGAMQMFGPRNEVLAKVARPVAAPAPAPAVAGPSSLSAIGG